jgi:hypothetical protein
MQNHDMKDSILLARCLAWQLLLLHFDFFEQVNTLTSKTSIEYDTDSCTPLMAGLSHCKMLPDMKIMVRYHAR